jgi:hypothetical protein
MKRSTALAAALLCGVILTGCSVGKPLPDLVSVTGTVTLDGQPLPHGTVGFAPADQAVGQPASGKIKDGKFTMVTSASSPGVVIGDYKVTIVSVDEEPVELPPDFVPNPNEPPPEPSSLIPKKYNDVENSGLEVSVSPGMGPIQFELDSAE